MVVPFRWDLSRREQLGRLVAGDVAKSYPGFLDDLRSACARIVARSGDSRLVFVGRSPESFFDYLSGIVGETSWNDRLDLLNVSLKRTTDPGNPQMPETRAAWAHFTALNLDPDAIARAPRAIAFIDLVYEGETFGHLVSMLLRWAEDAGVDPRAVRRRIRLLGITRRTKNSPNTWRWKQRLAWARLFRPTALKSVSISDDMWGYLGDWQDKVTEQNPPQRWGLEDVTSPPRDPRRLAALRLALSVFDHGSRPEERRRFAVVMSRQREMREVWVRDLVLELRGVSG